MASLAFAVAFSMHADQQMARDLKDLERHAIHR